MPLVVAVMEIVTEEAEAEGNEVVVFNPVWIDALDVLSIANVFDAN